MSEKLKKSRKTPSAKSKDEGLEKQKGLTLFDHIKHIQKFQDPDYYTSLTDLDKKTFNHFMILRGLSMNPELLEIVALMYRYMDVIPSPQFYKTLISFIPPEHSKAYHPWIKSKKNAYSDGLVELIARKFEVSHDDAIEYIKIYSLSDKGIQEMYEICRGFGLTDKEVESLLSNDK